MAQVLPDFSIHPFPIYYFHTHMEENWPLNQGQILAAPPFFLVRYQVTNGTVLILLVLIWLGS